MSARSSDGAGDDGGSGPVGTELSRDMSLFDITFVGATREGLTQRLSFGAIPEEVGQRAKGTVITTRRSRGTAARIKRWFRRHNG